MASTTTRLTADADAGRLKSASGRPKIARRLKRCVFESIRDGVVARLLKSGDSFIGATRRPFPKGIVRAGCVSRCRRWICVRLGVVSAAKSASHAASVLLSVRGSWAVGVSAVADGPARTRRSAIDPAARSRGALERDAVAVVVGDRGRPDARTSGAPADPVRLLRTQPWIADRFRGDAPAQSRGRGDAGPSLPGCAPRAAVAQPAPRDPAPGRRRIRRGTAPPIRRYPPRLCSIIANCSI